MMSGLWEVLVVLGVVFAVGCGATTAQDSPSPIAPILAGEAVGPTLTADAYFQDKLDAAYAASAALQGEAVGPTLTADERLAAAVREVEQETLNRQELPAPTLTINEEADAFLKEFIATDDLRQRIEALESEVKRLQNTNLATPVVPRGALSQSQCHAGGVFNPATIRGCYVRLYADTLPRNYWHTPSGQYLEGLLRDEYHLSEFHRKHDK